MPQLIIGLLIIGAIIYAVTFAVFIAILIIQLALFSLVFVSVNFFLFLENVFYLPTLHYAPTLLKKLSFANNTNAIPLIIWSTVGMVLGLFVAAYKEAPRYGLKSWRPLLILLPSMGLIFLAVIHTQNAPEPTKKATRLADEFQNTLLTRTTSNIRSGPGIKYPVVTVVPKGTNLYMLYEHRGWYKVKLSSGRIGFISKKIISKKGKRSVSKVEARRVAEGKRIANKKSRQKILVLKLKPNKWTVFNLAEWRAYNHVDIDPVNGDIVWREYGSKKETRIGSDPGPRSELKFYYRKYQLKPAGNRPVKVTITLSIDRPE